MEDVCKVVPPCRLCSIIRRPCPWPVSFPSAQTPEWDTYRAPSELWAWSRTIHACPVHSARLHLTCMPQYEKPLAIFCDLETWECLLCSSCWLLPPPQAAHVVEGNEKVYDLCSRTAVNLLQLFILSAFGEKESLYSNSRDFMLHIRGYPIILS